MQENKVNQIVLLVSVILGVLAMVLAFTWLSEQDAKRVPPMNIVVAAHDLAPGHPLDPERDLKVVPIPDIPAFRALANRALNVDSRLAVKGQRINHRILAEQQIMLADFSAAADLELRAGYVAIAIPARGFNALGGLLIPGDLVKVMVTFPTIRPDDASKLRGSALGGTSSMQFDAKQVITVPVKVLAVGSRLIRSRQQFAVMDQYEGGQENESQQTVTLEVTEAQAKDILAQTGAGQLPVTLILVTPANAAAALTSTTIPSN